MLPYSDARLHEAFLQWMANLDLESAIAVTVTFKRKANGRPISEKAAADAVRVFGRMLQSAACGSRFKKGKECITFVAVNEGGRDYGQKHPHIHMLVEVPTGWSMDAWIDFVKRKIEKIEDFGSEHCVKPVVDGGWIEYMLKRSDKVSYANAIDFISLWINSRSN